MPRFSKSSKRKLETCDQRLQDIFNEVIKTWDCTIVCGYRGEFDQNKAYHDGKSSLRFPKSKHNKSPSLAVDVVPYFKDRPHIRWNNAKAFHVFAGYVYRVAEELGYKVRWGGNWNMGEIESQSFEDLPHWEVID